MIYEKLGSYLRKVYVDGFYSSRISIHEGIKAQVYVLGYRELLHPILEADVKIGRIDCIFLKGDTPVCAIEVDNSIKQKSIEKLKSLPESTEKIIIAYCSSDSTYNKALSRHKGNLNGIRVFRPRKKRDY